MGDHRLADHLVEDDKKSDESDAAAAKLLADSQEDEAGDKNVEKPAAAAGNQEPRDYREAFQNAIDAHKELDSLKDVTGKIQISDGSSVKQIDAASYRRALTDYVDGEYKSALDAARKIEPENLDKIEQRLFDKKTLAEMDGLIKKYGFDKQGSLGPQQIKDRIKTAKSQTEVDELARLEQLVTQRIMLLELRHAQANISAQYAGFLLEQGRPTKAQDILKEAAGKDRELAADKAVYKPLMDKAERGMLEKQGLVVNPEDNPFTYTRTANELFKNGDLKGAEAAFKKALELADRYTPEYVQAQQEVLQKEIEKVQAARPVNIKKVEKLAMLQEGWRSMEPAGSVARLAYAEFLMHPVNKDRKGRWEEANKQFERVEKDTPELVALDKGFLQMKEIAQRQGRVTRSPRSVFARVFKHIDHFEAERQKGEKANINNMRAELEAAIKEASDPVNMGPEQRKNALENRQRYEQYIKDEQAKDNPDKDRIAAYEAQRNYYDSLYNLAGVPTLMLAHLEGLLENRATAREHLAVVEKEFPEMMKSEKWKVLGYDQSKELAREIPFHEQAWDFVKGSVKEVTVAVAAISAGAATFAVLTGSTLGFGAPVGVAGGVVAGTAAGSAVRKAWGDEVTLETMAFDGLGGLSGGLAVCARGAVASQAALNAERAMMKAGLDTTALEGLKGFARREAAVGLMRNAGVRAPGFFANAGWRMAANGSAAFSGSVPWRAGQTAKNYYDGKYKSLTDAARDYGKNVFGDTTTGLTMGAYERTFLGGLGLSAVTQTSREALFGNSKDGYQFGSNVLGGMMGDLVVGGKYGFTAGLANTAVQRWKPNLAEGVRSVWVAAAPEIRVNSPDDDWKALFSIAIGELKGKEPGVRDRR